MRVTERNTQNKCPYYYVKNKRLRSCGATKSHKAPSITKETYFCKTNEYSGCLTYIGHKFSTFKKQKAV